MKQHTTAKRPASTKPENIAVLLAAYLTVLLAYLLCAFVPGLRVWGFNWWAYHPVWLISLFALLGFGVAAFVFRWFRRQTGEEPEGPLNSRPPTMWFVAIGTIMTAGFVFLPSATHFLGDGYQLLDRLANDAPLIKAWDLGASTINRTIFALLGKGDEAARQTFQIVSLLGGLIVLVTAGWFARQLPTSPAKQLLVFAGLTTGGYMLQFFGYVENYALLIAGIFVYTAMGVQVVQGKLRVWWLLLPLAFSLIIHLWAIALLPSFAYLFLRKTRAANALHHMPVKKKIALAIVTAIGLVIIHQLLYRADYFFTFALLPLIPDRFMVDNDWLFSPKHLADMLNLLFLLVPCAILAVLALGRGRWRMLGESPYLFVLTVLVPALAMVYLFNPGIGMPRNWDLFAIAGPPLVMLSLLIMQDNRIATRMSIAALGLAVSLNLLSLTPRVLALSCAEIGANHFRNYLALDPLRNRNAHRFLYDYYRGIGDHIAADREQRAFERDFPETKLGQQGRELMSAGNLPRAMNTFRQILEMNPIYYDAWANLGTCYMLSGRLDSALEYLEIANGLNPYNAQTLGSLGRVYFSLQDYQRAEHYLRKALRTDSTETFALMGLVSVTTLTGQHAETVRALRILAQQDSVPAEFFLETAEALAQNQANEEAKAALRMAQAKGVDPKALEQLFELYPQIRSGD